MAAARRLAALAAVVVGITFIGACSTDRGPGGAGEADASDSSVSTADPTAAAPSSAGRTDEDTAPTTDVPDSSPGAEPVDAPRPPVTPVSWEACGDGLECGEVSVPLDHADPDGERIGIALIRRPATGAAKGTIFLNPGGPGGSGVTVVRGGYSLGERTMEHYHLVGFDPRGIGESSPLQCQIDLATGPRPDFSPDSPEEAAALDDLARKVASDCAQTDGRLLPHLGTADVVDDLELLRQAVGDDRLHYMGLSYGTLIGLRYAQRHPELVGRMVLDGVVDPSFTLVDLLTQQAEEFERAFDTLDAACGTQVDCPGEGIDPAYRALMEALEQSGPQGEVGTAEVQIATLISMYSEGLWQRYADALGLAGTGDLSGIERLHDIYAGATSFTAYAAVSCIDSRSPSGAEGWDRLANRLSAVAPRFGAALANEIRPCAYWPVTADTNPEPVTAPGSGPILVLSTTGDAPTPLANAITVAAGLSDASLVTVENEGHTAYGKNFCVERVVDDYFESGTLPGDVHRC